MKPIRTLFLALAATTLAVTPLAAAPRQWLLPSETNLTGGGDEWVTFDAAMSTDLYYPDHPAQNWEPVAFAPDGSPVEIENKAKGRLRQTFDLHVTQRGTYKVAVVSTTVMGSFLLNGQRQPLPRGTTPDTLAKAIPEGATEVWTAENVARLETFATAGAPTTMVFKASGKGVEMVPVTHPTDLAVGQPATFQFLLDGKPAAGLVVSAVNGGVRYSDGLQQIELKTGADGKVTIKWPTAGMWWVGASLASEAPAGPAPQPAVAGAAAGAAPQGGEGPRPMMPPQRRASYAMTVEVLG